MLHIYIIQMCICGIKNTVSLRSRPWPTPMLRPWLHALRPSSRVTQRKKDFGAKETKAKRSQTRPDHTRPDPTRPDKSKNKMYKKSKKYWKKNKKQRKVIIILKRTTNSSLLCIYTNIISDEMKGARTNEMRTWRGRKYTKSTKKRPREEHDQL